MLLHSLHFEEGPAFVLTEYVRDIADGGEEICEGPCTPLAQMCLQL
jgi:hypothetical protein